MVQIPLHGDHAAPRVAEPAEVDFFGMPVQQSRGLPAPASDAAATLTVVPAPELMNPLTGEIVDEHSIDDLIDCYEQIDRFDKQIYAVKQRIKRALLDKTEGEAATRRIAGARRIAKLTMPSESFQQATLKRLWEEYPELAATYLRISEIAVNMRDFNKLRGTSSDQADLVAFRDALTTASNGRAGLPSVSVEK